MRIGLFTDTYHPATNGIVAVVDITRKQLELAGHEVYVFCPGVRSDEMTRNDPQVIRFPSLPSGLFDDNRVSMFFPPRVMRQIRELELDVIHFFTPLQVGLMGVYAAQRTGAVLVGQHSTDFYQYVEHYPQVLPGLLALGTTLPFTVKFDGVDVRTLLSMYRPHRESVQWNRGIVEKCMALIYGRCDAVVALSRKNMKQLKAWRGEYFYDVVLMPTGVDALPKSTTSEQKEFRDTWGIAKTDELIGYIGRLGAEKNLDLVVDAFRRLAPKRPNLKLLFVGDFDYRDELEQLAAQTGYGERVIFTGRMPRDELDVAYRQLDVFIFPSMTDTQGLVVHEAAAAGCPLVLVDRYVSEVLHDGVNGYYASESGLGIARKVAKILDDPELKKQFGAESRKLARVYSEKSQIAKQLELYRQLLQARD